MTFYLVYLIVATVLQILLGGWSWALILPLIGRFLFLCKLMGLKPTTGWVVGLEVAGAILVMVFPWLIHHTVPLRRELAYGIAHMAVIGLALYVQAFMVIYTEDFTTTLADRYEEK